MEVFKLIDELWKAAALRAHMHETPLRDSIENLTARSPRPTPSPPLSPDRTSSGVQSAATKYLATFRRVCNTSDVLLGGALTEWRVLVLRVVT